MQKQIWILLAGTVLLVGYLGSRAGADSREPVLKASMDLRPLLRSYKLEPRVQGKRGTCSAFVVTAAIEFAVARKSGKCPRLSVEYLNWASNHENGDRKDGGFFSDLWKGFEAHGICAETTLPYASSFRPALEPPAPARQEAKIVRRLGLQFHWIKEWDPKRGLTDVQLRSVRETLASGWPVCGGFLWPKKQVWRDGILQMCPRDAVRDGHSVLLVGYRDDPALPGGGVFLIRNTSGDSRDGLLTYGYVKAYMNDAAWIDTKRRAPETASLAGRRFRFEWKSDRDSGVNGAATLKADGTIDGIQSPNESTWELDPQGRLLFKHADGRVSTRYDQARVQDGLLCFEGPFLFRAGIKHSLTEVVGFDSRKMNCIPPEQAERIRYSTQSFFYLDSGEAFTFRLKSGVEKSIRLESVVESRDSVIDLARSARVVVTIDGKRVELLCAPYVMPKEVDGLRIQADTTSAWLEMPKRVQFSVWDASDSVVDTSLFGFPLPGYRLFSQGMQAYNEPVHLGHRDGDPAGQRFHHNYGVDFAGCEGRQKVVSCIDGTVVRVEPGEGTLCVRDDQGVILMFGHLDSLLSGIRQGTSVKRGQWVGMLGKKGASGNFSHLHVGVYLSESALMADRSCRNINLYPWLVTAYLESTGEKLFAVARPHHTVRTGETVVFDGSSSLARGERIASYRWVFPDGARRSGPRAESVYDKPGCYTAALWVEGEQGSKDVDFCRVRVYSRPEPEPVIPTIFATFTPAGGVRAGSPVHFRLWPQGRSVDGIRMDFGDGKVLENYEPHSAVTHVFKKPGIHVVTASGVSAGLPVMQQLKVVVQEP